MYDLTIDTKLLRQRASERGMSLYRISQKSGVCYRTVRRVMLTGSGWPQSIYRIAKELGFEVRQTGRKPPIYDFTAIVLKRKTA